jgi:uncharacterized membrane protein YeaQ/YmgE (transglycosylase-associated protein family)
MTEVPMTFLEVLIYLTIAGITGAVGQSLAGFSGGGCLASIALGFIGALLGSWLAGLLGLPEIFVVQVGNRSFPLVWAILGSTLFVALLGALTRRRRPPPAPV